MDHAETLRAVHRIAGEFSLTTRRTTPARGAIEDGDNLLLRYGFSSLEALEFLLILEERMDVVLEDEELTQEILSSATQLANYIVRLRSKG